MYTPAPLGLMLLSVEKATSRPSPVIDGFDEYRFHSTFARLTAVVTPVVRFLMNTSGHTDGPEFASIMRLSPKKATS